MLVAISGSQGQGKSTTIDELVKQKNDNFIAMPNKTARQILSNWNLKLEDVYADDELTITFQEEILHQHLKYTSELVHSDSVILVERSFADIFTYAACILGASNKHSDWLNNYYFKCNEANSIFDHIMYLSGRNVAPQLDGVRSINYHFSKIVDMGIHYYSLKFCENTKTQMSDIECPKLADRVRMIRNVISGVSYGH